jgi:hypothetical protein
MLNLDREIEHALKIQRIKGILGLRKSSCDSIKITPRVSFFEGTLQHPIRHITSGKGRLVSNGLISVANLFGTSSYNNWYYNWAYSYGIGNGTYPPIVPSLRLGTGTSSTTPSTNNLATPITTPPNTATGSLSNPSAGIYRATFNATWNAGTIGTPTINEAGLWVFGNNVLQVFGATFGPNALFLADRVCSTDGDFASFAVNATRPLTLQYQVQAQFA